MSYHYSYKKIDFIDYFVHRETSLISDTLSKVLVFMKRCAFRFLDVFLDEQYTIIDF